LPAPKKICLSGICPGVAFMVSVMPVETVNFALPNIDRLTFAGMVVFDVTVTFLATYSSVTVAPIAARAAVSPAWVCPYCSSHTGSRIDRHRGSL
jgi:hypothetical protein